MRDLVDGELWLAPGSPYPIVLQVRDTPLGLRLVPLAPQQRDLTYAEAIGRWGTLTHVHRYAHVVDERDSAAEIALAGPASVADEPEPEALRTGSASAGLLDVLMRRRR